MLSKIIILSILLFIISCSEKKKIDEKYLKIYKEILIVGLVNNDSLVASNKKDSVFKSYDMTEKEFREWTIELAKNREIYLKTLDSLRNSILLQEKNIKQNME